MSGNHHLKYVQVCDCEPHAVTLLKCQFWPGSPANPTTGFSFKLMEFVEKVFLHCQVSLLNITEVITELNPQLQPTHVGLLTNSLFETWLFLIDWFWLNGMFFFLRWAQFTVSLIQNALKNSGMFAYRLRISELLICGCTMSSKVLLILELILFLLLLLLLFLLY